VQSPTSTPSSAPAPLHAPHITPVLGHSVDARAHNPALDGLRGLAVLMVYVFHYGGGLQSPHRAIRFLGYVTETGWIGVVLFFALSGFLITGSLWDSFNEPNCLRNFYARRVLRIFPLYYAALAVTTIAALASGTRFVDLHPLAIYAFFLQDLPFLAEKALLQPSPLPLYHLWSLAVEEQFYLLWPFLLWMAVGRRRAFRLSLWIFAAAVVFRLVVYGMPYFASTVDNHLFDSFLLTHAGALALGAALALGVRGRERAALLRWAPDALFAGVAIYLGIGLFTGSLVLNSPLQYMVGLPAISIAAAALVALMLRPGLANILAHFRPLRWLGRISYGFYVLHILLEPLFDTLGAHLTHSTSGTAYQTARFVVAFPITLAAAWLSYEFLEIPFLHKKRHFPMANPVPQE
jgi:peptidoglycan/LPS O-acetylase OafA/YrhL